MRHPIVAGALALFFIGASSWAEGASDSSDHWFDTVAGKKLVAVDDSSLLVTPSEDGLSLQIISPTGVERDLSLSYVGDGVGMVSDGDAKPIGVFRQTDDSLQAEFSDGHTELFEANADGGISMVLSTPQSSAYCMRWYPDGHVFDVADRKAALAAYASKLGLSDTVAKEKESAACDDPASASAKSRRVTLQKHETPAPEQSASTQPIMVRVSQVHTIDPIAPGDVPLAQGPQLVIVPTPKIPPPAPQPVPRLSHDTQASVQPAFAPGIEASTCLSVDSNGAGWGFRNTCGYNVQFAYCLKNATDKSAACGSGTGSGDVRPNGFALVLDNSEIVTAEEEFRWVACAGSADQVAAHLDRPDPPAGRCVPVRTL